MNRRLAISMIVVVTAATFARVVGNAFVGWDDPETIAQNPRVKTPTLKGVAHYWRHQAGGLYVPVTYTYWAMLAPLGRGVDARVYHGASILLHLVSALLVFSVVRQLVAHDGAALVGALVFAVHPVQVEPIAWASGAKDLLAGLFSLAMIDQFLRLSAKRQAGGGIHYAAALVLFALAVLSKPSAVVAPVIAGVLVWVREGTRFRSPIVALAPMLTIALACAVWSRIAQWQYAITETPLWARPLIALDAIAFYLWKLVWPTNLAIVYGRTPGAVMQGGAVYCTWVAPVAVGVLAWLLRRRIPWLWTGFVLFVVGLVPVLGFLGFMFQIHSTVADHYLYLPMLGVAIAVGGAVSARPNAIVTSCSTIILVILALVSVNQISHWRNSESLYARVVTVNPNSAFARAGLGRAYAESGRIRDAVRQFEAAVALAPDSRTAQASLAQAYLLDGRPDDAIEHATRAIALAGPGEDTSWEQFILARATAARGGATTQPEP